ncbi:MAG: putative O-glycosylation ligase, exosortase A system-associated [Pseudomonadota bacterium]|nr:putative O-glycosylation ligase, exosortase A system-associated [Pseudomonadota bacterium]
MPPLRDFIVTALVFIAIPFILKRPYIGILVFSWLGYMNPHRLTWGFAYNMPFSMIVALTTMVAMIFHREMRKIPLLPITVVWLVWIVWMNITTVLAMLPSSAFLEWDRAMKIQLMALITMMLMQSEQRIKWLIYVIVGSIGFYGVKGGIFTIATGGQYLIFGPENSFFQGNNGLGLVMLMVLPLMRFVHLQLENRWARIGMVTMMLLTGLSILATYSRGAVVGAAAVGVYLLLKSRKKLLFIPVTVLTVVLVILPFMPDSWYQRVETIKDFRTDPSVAGRFNAWSFAWNIAQERPIAGGGYGVFSKSLFLVYAPDPEDFHDAHSIYFEALAEQGFVGLGIYLILGIFAFRQCKKIMILAKSHARLQWAYDLASMLSVSLVAYAVCGLFLGLAYFDLYYHIIALLILTRNEVNKVLSETAAPARANLAGRETSRLMPR